MQIYFLLITFTQNNIFLNLINHERKLLLWKSLGMSKTKGLKKLNSSIIKNFILISLESFLNNSQYKLHIKLKGFNKCKKLFLKTIITSLMSSNILSISDNSTTSNNGCKLKKKRRL